MGRFLEQEKQRYLQYKQESHLLPDEARKPGVYRKKPRPFCLPREYADFNLFGGIRDEVQQYFDQFAIKWHDGVEDGPSNHLCDSQVCCVNFLFPFADQPNALKTLLKPLFPEAQAMLPVEGDDIYVAHEWIGAENYLGERMSRHGKRTRGANFTSADAAVFFEQTDGKRHFVLIEWKYTETYSPTSYHYSKSGTDRTEIYRHLFEMDDFPLKKDLIGEFSWLFYEPFYQLLRQQLLANEMEKAGEKGADIVSLLHIAPAANLQFNRVTSPPLRELGDRVIEIWKDLVRQQNRFSSISVEELFAGFPFAKHPDLDEWWGYLRERYPWFMVEPDRE